MGGQNMDGKYGGEGAGVNGLYMTEMRRGVQIVIWTTVVGCSHPKLSKEDMKSLVGDRLTLSIWLVSPRSVC